MYEFRAFTRLKQLNWLQRTGQLDGEPLLERVLNFTPTDFRGRHSIDIEPIEDERGFFSRLWCRRICCGRALR